MKSCKHTAAIFFVSLVLFPQCCLNDFKLVIKIFERKTVRKIYGPVNEAERWRIRTNVEIKDVPQGAGIVKFIQNPPTKMV